MSFPARVQCSAGCGGYGDPDLAFLCVACHGDRAEQSQFQELKAYTKQRARADADNAVDGSVPSAEDHRKIGSPSRRLPPAVDHRRGKLRERKSRKSRTWSSAWHAALEDFLSLPRERNASIIERELEFLQRQLAIRNTSAMQLRKYMVASDTDEEVDPKEWGRYQYGEPRAVPRTTVDRAVEAAAQVRLFCAWRQRTIRGRVEAERQRLEAQRQEQRAKSKRFLPRSSPKQKSQAHPPSSPAKLTKSQGDKQAKPERLLFPSMWRRKTPSVS